MITTASQRLSSKDLETIKDVISKAKPFFPSDLLVHDPTCKLDQLTAKEDFTGYAQRKRLYDGCYLYEQHH
ncbi:MAG: hypothetical protein IPL78_21365 [Chloroflexi bacterium]|nr:hypothetical protein [Chloroflexota bacterium]